MTPNGLEVILTATRKVHKANPQILQPIANHFGIDIDERLANPKYHEGLSYA
jgi:hypothetical protein